MSSCTTPGPEAQAAQGQINIIKHNQHILRFGLKESQRLPDGQAALVHESGRFYQCQIIGFPDSHDVIALARDKG
jgi:hypothetical protein